ncbi:hypothetical protein HDU97_003200 [Phlyctochytrium planicorne]|nr:hypothetical protein HDU97_003200 [Phlyctochytrium planicorne]
MSLKPKSDKLTLLLIQQIKTTSSEKRSPVRSTSLELSNKRKQRISGVLASARERLEELESERLELDMQRNEVLTLFEELFSSDPLDLEQRCRIGELKLSLENLRTNPTTTTVNNNSTTTVPDSDDTPSLMSETSLSSTTSPSPHLPVTFEFATSPSTSIEAIEKEILDAFAELQRRRVEIVERALEESGRGRTGCEVEMIVGGRGRSGRGVGDIVVY